MTASPLDATIVARAPPTKVTDRARRMVSRHFGRHWPRTVAQIEILSVLLLIRVGQIGHIMHFRHITVSGEPGSGKSSVGRELARIYGMDIVSTGALQRELAASLGVSIVDVNKRAELDQSIDSRIDSILQGKGAQTTALIFDSRLAWHFVPNAFKLHLIVDPTVAAERLHRTRESNVESYTSVEHAAQDAHTRSSSERSRFRDKYGVDIFRLRNYDLVIDTSDAPLDMVVSEVLQVLNGPPTDGLQLRASPRRVIPTIEPARELAAIESGAAPAWEQPVVGYSSPEVFALRGHDALSRALIAKQVLVPALLESEGGEEVTAGITADEFLFTEAQRKWMYDWENIHGFRFPLYPDTADQVGRK